MIQSIVDGIVAALLEAFPDVKVYDEEVKQGLEEPCFIVRCITPKNELFFDRRYRRDNLFSVQYIHESETDANTECNDIIDALYQTLELITVNNDLVRGTGMQGEYSDGIMTFLVNYNLFVIKAKEIETMGDLTIENIEVMGDLTWQKQT